VLPATQGARKGGVPRWAALLLLLLPALLLLLGVCMRQDCIWVQGVCVIVTDLGSLC
jgi:hypothetical protein